MKIYHNPRCRKSRETLSIVQEQTPDVEIVEYLKNPPSTEELSNILQLLKLDPEDIIRKNEKLFKENYKGQQHTRAEWLKILVDNPILIERPIVVSKNKAVIGRPPENVKTIL